MSSAFKMSLVKCDVFIILVTLVLINSVIIVSAREVQENEKDYATALISQCGYPYEVHRNIQTEDGYLLTMHRIPPKSKEQHNHKRHIPVLLMHGLLGSAEHFLLLNCTDSLPYLLADQGYDVWLGNVRTVSYSRHHVSLDPDSPEYWQITMDEFGSYDLPTFIDYILKTTEHKQIMFIGHSQGNMIYFIMCSNKPEYASKVQLFVSLSPVATLNKFPHPWLGVISPYVTSLQSFVDRFGLYEWTLGRDFVREYGGMMCNIIPGICKYIVYLFSGLPPSRLENDQFQRLLTNCPEGIAAKQFIHYCHMVNDLRLEKFNFGTPEGNMEHYGTEMPPKYNLTLTTTPSAIYYSKNDWFLSANEVRKFVKDLRDVVDFHEIPVEDFSHFDFIIGHLAPQHLYPRIIALINKFRDKQLLQITVNRESSKIIRLD